ncbi:MAG: bifunctional RNase H/acid phosphatase [Actinomycetota bacterium]|nr:bifunctional RNase H/acid phosphatase [Actinomycetota bacterium]
MARRLVVEADGGSRGNPGPAAYGALVRDADTGELLTEVAEHIGIASNNVAEYRGLIAGLDAVRGIDPDAQVEVRMDSKLVVEQMSGRWQIKHPAMRPLAAQARAALPPTSVRYRWVPREQNRAADRLANEALDAAAAGRPWTPRGGSPAPVVDEAEVEPAPQNALVGWATDLGEPTTFVLLRHGATVHTVDKRFSGAGGDDPSLSDEGRRQAERAAAALLARGGVDAVVSSPMRRAVQTAAATAGVLGLEVRLEEDFRECAFGEWDGWTFAEVQEKWPAELAAWLADPAVAPPGGESFEAVAARVRAARDRTIARYAGRAVLVVSHVTPIKQLVRLALGAPPAALYRMELAPTSLSIVQWYADGNASLRLFNDTGHAPSG